MSDTFCEGNLLFDFSASICAERLDLQGVPLPQGMALVDFVVEDEDRTLLVEVKGPGAWRIPKSHRARAREDFVSGLSGSELINLELVPKARDSYTFLHLMKRDHKPCVSVVVLALPEGGTDLALLGPFKDRLLRRLRQEAAEPWQRPYVSDCVVVTPGTWGKYFEKYPLTAVRWEDGATVPHPADPAPGSP